MKFICTKKNIILISVSAVLTIILSLLTVLFIINSTKKELHKPASSFYSDIIQESFLSDEESSDVAEVSSEEKPEIQLAITSPASLNSTVTTSKTVITGISDIKSPLLMNGINVERSSDGSFSVDVQLSVGVNTFTFEHKGVTKVCKIKYRYVVINSYSPSIQEKYSSGSTFVVSTVARVNSNVNATFNGKTITLKPAEKAEDKEFICYTGSFTLPNKNETDINLGKVKFTGFCSGVTEVFYSGNIICEKNKTLASRPYVAKVVAFTAETFSGSTTDDFSDPRNNYLPQGTVDYCDSGLIYDPSSKNTYIKLRCGRRVYVDKPSDDKKSRIQVTTRYKGALPDHNEISVASFEQSGRHTVIKFDTMWKAPFLLDILPQSYKNPSVQDFTFSKATFNHIDITFCYATKFEGEINIPKSNPIFSKAEIIPSGDKYILRLHLKTKGKFYGWDSYYNDKNQLCFEFLNPVNTKLASNGYGVDLTGAKILIDAGHGGRDPGALRGSVREEERNLNLAKKIKTELESIGATVVMTRTGNYTVTSDERRLFMKNQRPDYCISIHHNAASVASANGFEGFHFNSFSRAAAKMVHDRTMKTGFYKKSKFQSHYFFLSRITTCPVVLTESGYFTNTYDFNNILNESITKIKAKAIVKGIADYFISIQYTPVVESEIESHLQETSKPLEDSNVSSKDSNVSSKDSNVSSKDSNVSSKDSNVSSKDSNVSSKDSNVSSKDSSVSSKDSNVSSEESNVSSEESNVSSEESNVSSEESNVSSENSENSSHEPDIPFEESPPEVLIPVTSMIDE